MLHRSSQILRLGHQLRAAGHSLRYSLQPLSRTASVSFCTSLPSRTSPLLHREQCKHTATRAPLLRSLATLAAAGSSPGEIVQNMTAEELAVLLKEDSDDTQFIDVREPSEYDVAKLPHFQLLPLSRFQEWAPEIVQKLDKNKKTICLCHAGMRSMRMAYFLADQGFTDVHNVEGGIEAYSCNVDPSVPRY